MAMHPPTPPSSTSVEANITPPSAPTPTSAAAAGISGGDGKCAGGADEQGVLAAAAGASVQDGGTTPQQQLPSSGVQPAAVPTGTALPPTTPTGTTASPKEEPKEMDIGEYQRQLDEAERRKRIRVGKGPPPAQNAVDADTAMEDSHGDDL